MGLIGKMLRGLTAFLPFRIKIGDRFTDSSMRVSDKVRTSDLKVGIAFYKLRKLGAFEVRKISDDPVGLRKITVVRVQDEYGFECDEKLFTYLFMPVSLKVVYKQPPVPKKDK